MWLTRPPRESIDARSALLLSANKALMREYFVARAGPAAGRTRLARTT
jgi:hypothetical protein